MRDYLAKFDLPEAKRIERVLILQRWFYIPALIVAACLFDCLFTWPVWGGCIMLVVINLLASYGNSHITSVKSQLLLGFAVLFLDTVLVGWGSLYIAQTGSIVVVVAFFLIVAEAAVRFELRGSLIFDIISSVIILFINFYSQERWGVSLTISEYLLFIGVMGFVSLMIGMVARSARKQRQTATSLIQEKALINERHRVSNELHDSVLKSLQGLSMEAYALSQSDDTKVQEKAVYFGEVCNKMSQEIRSVILELRDDAEEVDFSRQLTRLVHEFEAKYKIETKFMVVGEEYKLPLKVNHDLYAILEEALYNVAKHAEATNVEVQLCYGTSSVSLKVQDDGVGIKMTQDEIISLVNIGKIGLASMKERTESNQGVFSITSLANGTLVNIEMPVDTKHSGE